MSHHVHDQKQDPKGRAQLRPPVTNASPPARDSLESELTTYLIRTHKDLTKAIGGFMPTARFPLPDDLVEIIDAYLNTHEKFEESVADKVHDELLSIFNREVTQIPSRYTPFLAILRYLRPVIGQPAKIFQWFDLLLPALNYLNQEKGLASVVESTLLDILTAEDGNDPSSPTGGAAPQLAERTLLLWLEEYEAIGRAPDALSDFKEKQLRRTLLHYGKRRPKDLLTVVDLYVAKKASRARALSFLAIFVQSQPPHLHLILQTPLFGNLINCLQLDTSTTIVSLALTALTMILPHMPSSLVPHLPTLFNIYARLLFWERELSSQMAADVDKDRRLSPNTLVWEKFAYSADFDDTTIPQLLHYFTILYGLYPINFVDYIRKPQRYLRHAEVADADDIEVQPTEIRHASERFRQCHLLHENFYTLTIDSEKTDFGRWIKSEPAEVVADCVALCQLGETLSGQGVRDAAQAGESEKDESDKDGHDSALLSSSYPFGTPTFSPIQGDNRRNTMSTFESITSSRIQPVAARQSSISSHHSNRDSISPRPSGVGGESPTLPRQIIPSGSQTQLQDLINSNKVIKSGLHQSMANDSVPSLALSHHDSISDHPGSQLQPNLQSASAALSPSESNSAQIAHLQRQILLLYNDLTFERFMKQQHLTHMGELRRRHVREAASEAETQNLIIQNRQLRQRLKDAKESEVQAKRESEKSRTLSKKWEADLTAKLRALREEQRKWNGEANTLRTDLDAAKGEADKLRGLVCEAEVRELGLKQNMQSVEINVGELERLRREVERLTQSERNYQAKEAERQAVVAHAAGADSRAEMLNLTLRARDSDAQQTYDDYKSQIATLNAKLQDAIKKGMGRNSEEVVPQFENALAASRAQQTELKNRIGELTKKNTALQATILELQATVSNLSKPDHPPPMDPEFELDSDSGSPLSHRSRQHLGFSDSEVLDATSFNATPPLEPYTTSSSGGSQIRRPSTPLATNPPATAKDSPATTERYFGRGGVQNLHKDKKNKKDEKERKKSSGLRGIRGF
ncbi:Hamartin protein-domain-containing protein [Hypoxylon cercidicola]|nr:Hamartin protein-domain-containing protein [Hypoxylon cercidicola]